MKHEGCIRPAEMPVGTTSSNPKNPKNLTAERTRGRLVAGSSLAVDRISSRKSTSGDAVELGVAAGSPSRLVSSCAELFMSHGCSVSSLKIARILWLKRSLGGRTLPRLREHYTAYPVRRRLWPKGLWLWLKYWRWLSLLPMMSCQSPMAKNP